MHEEGNDLPENLSYTFGADLGENHTETVSAQRINGKWRVTSEDGIVVEHEQRTAAVLAMAARRYGYRAELRAADNAATSSAANSGRGGTDFDDVARWVVGGLVVLFVLWLIFGGGGGSEEGSQGEQTDGPGTSQTDDGSRSGQGEN